MCDYTETVLDSIVDHVTILGWADEMQKNILSHFDVELRSIIRTILRGAVNGDDTTRRTVEQCYN